AARGELGGLRFLDDAEALASRRVQDPARTDDEGHMVGALLVTVGQEVAGPLLPLCDRRSGRLLLPGIARDEHPGLAVGHMNEAGAVDTCRGQPTPLVRRAEVGACELEWLTAGC